VPLIAGHILGRFGDYFTGGHLGKVTNLPWAILALFTIAMLFVMHPAWFK